MRLGTMARSPQHRPADTAGLAARRIAADILEAVLRGGRSLEEQFEAQADLAKLPDRDRSNNVATRKS